MNLHRGQLDYLERPRVAPDVCAYVSWEVRRITFSAYGYISLTLAEFGLITCETKPSKAHAWAGVRLGAGFAPLSESIQCRDNEDASTNESG